MTLATKDTPSPPTPSADDQERVRRYIADRLREERLRRGISLDAATDLLGFRVSKSTLLNYERGTTAVPSDRLLLICRAYAITPAQLLPRDALDSSPESDVTSLMPLPEFQELCAFIARFNEGKRVAVIVALSQLLTLHVEPSDEASRGGILGSSISD